MGIAETRIDTIIVGLFLVAPIALLVVHVIRNPQEARSEVAKKLFLGLQAVKGLSLIVGGLVMLTVWLVIGLAVLGVLSWAWAAMGGVVFMLVVIALLLVLVLLK